MKLFNTLLVVTVALVFTASSAFAAITVVSVKGDALYSDGGAYKPLKKGQRAYKPVQNRRLCLILTDIW